MTAVTVAVRLPPSSAAAADSGVLLKATFSKLQRPRNHRVRTHNHLPDKAITKRNTEFILRRRFIYAPDERAGLRGGVDALAAAVEDEGVAGADEPLAGVIVHRRVGAEEGARR